jgi:hypothetical protein
MVAYEDMKKLAFAISEQEGRRDVRNAEHYLRAKKTPEEGEANQILELATMQPILELAEPPKQIALRPAPGKQGIRAQLKNR